MQLVRVAFSARVINQSSTQWVGPVCHTVMDREEVLVEG